MMFNKLTILATLVVAMSVASTVCGHPAAQSEDKLEETTTAKSGVLGWIKNVHEKIRGPSRGCNHTHEDGHHHHGGAWNWVKNKLGFRKTTTVAPPAATGTAATGVDRDGNRQPDVVGSDQGGRPETGDRGERPETAGGDEPTETETGGDEPTETETGDGAGRPGASDETGNRDEPTSDAASGGPETEVQDKSVGEDPFVVPSPAVSTETGSADIDGSAGDDLTPQSTSSSEVIDPRMDVNVKP